jgi:hypothetical protein
MTTYWLTGKTLAVQSPKKEPRDDLLKDFINLDDECESLRK